jgi:hypothetical protein
MALFSSSVSNFTLRSLTQISALTMEAIYFFETWVATYPAQYLNPEDRNGSCESSP